MPIFDELEGLLGADVIAKIPAEMRTKLEFGEELAGYYNGDTNDPPKPPVGRVARAPEVSVVAPPAFDLAALDSLFDKKLGNLDERISTSVNTMIERRASELVGAASAQALRQADELNTAHRRHRTDFGEDLDTTKFNEFVEKRGPKAFSSVTAAYEEFTSGDRVKKEIKDGVENGVRERLKERTSQNVPGYTPPSAKSPIAIFKARNTSQSTGSAVSAAAAELAARRQASNVA